MKPGWNAEAALSGNVFQFLHYKDLFYLFLVNPRFIGIGFIGIVYLDESYSLPEQVVGAVASIDTGL